MSDSKNENSSEQSLQSLQWHTLIHQGVQFPPTYEPLPDNVRIKYKGKPVKLSTSINNPFNVSAEEASVFFAKELEKDERLSEKNKNRKKTVDSKFKENFWNDWKIILGDNSVIKNIDDVDFSDIQRYIVERSEQKKAQRKAMSKEEKKQEKEEKEKLKNKYKYAIVDDQKIALGSYVIQPPGLFLGHGKQPLRGKIKKRISPEDITINISKGHIPPCKHPDGTDCKWGAIIEDKNVTWIASYVQPVNKEKVYVYLDRNESHFVTENDKNKFDKARKLKENITAIRKKYMSDMRSEKEEKKQLATAVYLLDMLAIRPGTEKDESKEAGTLGLTTLKCDNIEFHNNNKITINFVGKSSIPYVKTFEIDKIAYENLNNLCPTNSTKKMFPKVNSNSLNSYLGTLLPGLTAKSFRTWKASTILQEKLNEIIPDMYADITDKKIVYDDANIKVALALNHKRLLESDEKVEKLKNKIEELKEKKKEAKTDKQKASADNAIKKAESKLIEAKENIAMTTSKVNYLDPRITVVWCKKAGMPIEKIYNKTILKKFKWSMNTQTSWNF